MKAGTKRPRFVKSIFWPVKLKQKTFNKTYRFNPKNYGCNRDKNTGHPNCHSKNNHQAILAKQSKGNNQNSKPRNQVGKRNWQQNEAGKKQNKKPDYFFGERNRHEKKTWL